MATERGFEHFRTQVALAALAVTAASVIALVVAASWLSGVAQTALSSIASSFLAVGVITFIYDAYLRTSFTAEVLRLVGLRSDLAAAGIEEIREETDFRWNDFLAGGVDYRVLLLDPTTWIDREWPHILAAGRSRVILVEVYLVNPDGGALEHLADNVSLTTDELTQRVATAQRVLEDSWNTAAKSDPPIAHGSKLTVRLYDSVTAFALAAVDKQVVVLASGTLGRRPGEMALALRFDSTNSTMAKRWFDEQLAHLEQLPPSYVNEVN
jgi:hypothetical protein